MTEATSSVLVTKNSVSLHEMAAKARATYKQTEKKLFRIIIKCLWFLSIIMYPNHVKDCVKKVKKYLYHSDNKHVAIMDNYLYFCVRFEGYKDDRSRKIVQAT